MIFNKKNSYGFTLIELMVGITIIGILAFAMSNIDFNRLSNKQKLDIFAGKIKTNYELIRNNSMLGKGIGTELNIPEQWKLEFSKANSGTIISNTKLKNESWKLYKKLAIPENYIISSLKCLDLNNIELDTIGSTGTGIIEFNGINITLTGACNDEKSKILEIEVKNKVEKKNITINVLNGIVEIKN